MVTGDAQITAQAVAIRCNIINSAEALNDKACMLGPDFVDKIGGMVCETCGNISPHECTCGPGAADEKVKNRGAFKSMASSLKVVSRATPEAKY